MPDFVLKLRRSGTTGAAPAVSDLELGELAVNTYDGKLFLKKDVEGTATVVEVGQGCDLSWDASTATISSSSGDNVVISNATTDNPGLMSSTDKGKLDGIASGAETNVGTNLSYVANSSEIQSSTGTNVTLPNATATAGETGSVSGLMAGADKDKLDGITAGAEVNVGTNLTYTSATRSLNSSTGSNVALPLVGAGGTAGLMSGTDKSKLDSIQANAEVNVNADFNATSGDAQILNKPSIPANIGDLSNVNATAATDGQVLTWDNTNSYWIPANSNGTQLSTEEVQDIAGAMVSSNTESGITVTYQNSDGTLDFSLGNHSAGLLTSGTVLPARLPDTYTKAARVTIQATGTTNDVLLDAANHILLEAGEEENGAIIFRGNNGSSSYRFSKGGQTAVEGFLSFESLTGDKTFTFPNQNGTIALTSSSISGNAATATKLATARTISIYGDVTGTATSFDGSANISISASLPGIEIDNLANEVLFENTPYVEGPAGADPAVDYQIWHEGNQGALSGLDADLLDGEQGSYYTKRISTTPLTSSDNLNSVTNEGWYAWGNSNPSNSPGTYGAMWMVKDAGQLQQMVQTYGGSVNAVKLYGRRKTSGNWDTTWTEYWSTANDGAGSGLDSDTLDGQQGSYYLDYNNLTNVPAGGGTDADTVDSLHAASFLRSDASDSFTGSLTGSGDISLTGSKIECGRTSGSVAMTINDGYGNANICFNHTFGVPDVSGSACRIKTSVDNNTGFMLFQVADSVTGGSATTLTDTLKLTTGAITFKSNTVWHASNDGSGSGLDADTLDGVQASSFLRSDAADTFSGELTGASGANILLNSNIGGNGSTAMASMTGRLEFDSDYSDTARGPNKILLYDDGNAWISGFAVHNDTTAYYSGGSHKWYKTNSSTSFTEAAHLTSSGSLSTSSQGTLWGASNDGAGSGLDADALDGLGSGDFIRSNANDNVTGHTEWQDTIQARFGNGADLRIHHTSGNNFIDSYNGHIYIRNNHDNDSGDNIYLQAKSGEHSIICNDDGSVVLYNNGTAALTTLTSGDIRCHRNLVPDVTSSNIIGTASLRWSSGYINNLYYVQSLKTFGTDRFVLGHDGFSNNSGSNSWAQFVVEDTGEIIFGKDFADWGIVGGQFENKGSRQIFTTATGHLWRTNTTNGVVVSFYSNSTAAGQIQINSATVVAYIGGHLSRYSQFLNDERPEVVLGTILSNLDEMCEWDFDEAPDLFYEEGDIIPEGKAVGDLKAIGVKEEEAGIEDNLQLNRVKISDVIADRNVTGIFSKYEDDGPMDPHARKYDKYDDFTIAQSGDFVIRIGKDTVIQRGDLLMSAGDGTAMPQNDDIVRSCTIAKVNSASVREVYPDGSYLVPCTLML